jgi:hypothetical protein
MNKPSILTLWISVLALFAFGCFGGSTDKPKVTKISLGNIATPDDPNNTKYDSVMVMIFLEKEWPDNTAPSSIVMSDFQVVDGTNEPNLPDEKLSMIRFAKNQGQLDKKLIIGYFLSDPSWTFTSVDTGYYANMALGAYNYSDLPIEAVGM